jgi:hypothetical protein
MKKFFFFWHLEGRIRIRQSEVRIRGSGAESVPECHGAGTIIRGLIFIIRTDTGSSEPDLELLYPGL